MRQIAAEAGQANNSAIQYHFGTKAGLLREIILRRVAGFEPQRQRLLDSATSKRKLSDLRTMLEIIFRPIAECTNSRGRHIYARFIMQFLNSMQFHVETEHPGWAPDSAATRAALRIAACLPFLDAHRLTARINMIGGMFYNALIERDNMMKSGRPVEPEAVFLDDLFEIMTAAMMVPVKIGPKPRQLRGAK